MKPLAGHPPWLRLRAGELRILYRPADDGWLVARVIHRKDLERTVRSLE